MSCFVSSVQYCLIQSVAVLSISVSNNGRCSVHILHFTLHTTHCTLHTAQCTVYTGHYSLLTSHGHARGAQALWFPGIGGMVGYLGQTELAMQCIVQCNIVNYTAPAVQCSALHRRTAQRSAMHYSAAQCSAVQRSVAQCSAVQRSAAQCTAVQLSSAQCSAFSRPQSVQCFCLHYSVF